MNTIIPVASGKGGVGKSLLTTNIGLQLARMGKTVILVDLDMGASNLHTFLGIKNNLPGLGQFIHQKGRDLEELISPTNYDRLYFIPGDGLFAGTANIPFFMKNRILKQLKKQVADYILLDLGAGSNFNVLDFFITSNSSLLVTTPEPTSILNAYGFLKSAQFRILRKSFPAHSAEREMIKDFLSVRLEGSDTSMAGLFEKLDAHNPQSGQQVRNILKEFYPRVIINMVRRENELELLNRLRKICRNNLKMELEFLGNISYSDWASASVFRRKPLLELQTDPSFNNSMEIIAKAILSRHFSAEPVLHPDDDDLKGMKDNSDSENIQ